MSNPPSENPIRTLESMSSIRPEDLSKLCVHLGKPIHANELPDHANVLPLDWSKASQPIHMDHAQPDGENSRMHSRLREKLREKQNKRRKHNGGSSV